MQATDRAFDLVLSCPRWQGSGGPQHLHHGAMAAADPCGAFGPLVRVAEAGEGKRAGASIAGPRSPRNSVRRRTVALVRSAAAAGLVGLTITEFAPADERAAQEGSRFIRTVMRGAARR